MKILIFSKQFYKMQVSQNWFGEHERALATGILAMSLPLGIHKSLFIFTFTV
jgi:hypothetical protein